MKIVVVDPWHFTPPYDRELCQNLAAIGHDVTFVSSSSSCGGDDETAEGDGVRRLGLFSEPSPSIPRALSLLMKGSQHIRGMVRLLFEAHRSKPDIIHFQWLALPIIDIVFVVLLRRIGPVVLTVHDSNPYNGAGPWLLRAGNMTALRRCDRYIVHNDLSEQRLIARGLPKERIHQLAHGLLNQQVPTSTLVTRHREDRVHFLQFGKIKAYKGADVFLEALAALSPEHRRRCRISIVGRPYVDTQPLIDLVKRHGLEDMVSLRFDFVSDDDMSRLFEEADFLVFPYREIDTSGVLMAAVARAIPVVASEIGCFAEMLVDGKEGVLVPPGDAHALAEALVALIGEPEKRLAMRRHMEVLRDRIPSWRSIAESTVAVYHHARLQPTSKPVGAHP